MDYETIIKTLKEKNKIRLARFIEMYYIVQKPQEEIRQELYIESIWGFYSMRRRIANIIKTLIEDNKKL
jgi:hypothetical protein